MCGICGIFNIKEIDTISLEVLKGMILALHHRGPDEFGLYRDNRVGLASARLSIIDLAGGSQPISNEDGTVWIVFNGEIFNYIELRPLLEKKGHQFSTKTDTEVIIHLYEEFGVECLNYLNGQFSIALWDSRNQTLLLARDRLGIRPLFYYHNHHILLFASEIKSFLAFPNFHLELDEDALRQVFTYWSPQPPHTAFQQVMQLPAGHYLLLQNGEINVQPYWQLKFKEDTHHAVNSENQTKNDAEILENFASLLIDATQIRLRADVPVGAYLSGGLDSSTIAAIIRNHTQTPLDSFSIAFSSEEFNESDFQLEMARFLGTNHQVVYCTPEDIGQIFPEVVWHTETPVLRTAPAPMFLLSRLVRENGYKVVLTGEGADEILAGYDIFKEMKIRRFIARDPSSPLRPALLNKLYPDIPRIKNAGEFLTAFFQRRLQETDSPFYSHLIRWDNTGRTLKFLNNGQNKPDYGEIPLPHSFNSWSHLAQAQYLEIATFLSPYLLSSQGDRPAMAHSVEGRFPFLDYRLVEFCNQLPDHYKLRGLNEKYLLRKFASNFLPPEIWKRKKRPYRAPIKNSFFGVHPPEYVFDLLSEQNIARSEIFNTNAVKKLISKASAESQFSETEEMALVGIISTLLLEQQFVRRNHPLTRTTTTPIKIIDKSGNHSQNQRG
ncbi:MAG: asparagine synthase (glutamine-hydrolyzing) [Chloroflexota bacterium]